MNKTELIKKLLPGLVPLIVFILVDEFLGTTAGIITAVAVGTVQLVFIYFRSKIFDKFIAFDTALIVLLGLVSILLENEIFFKLKPGLIGIIICAILGISSFTKADFIKNMSARYMSGIEMNEEQSKVFRKSMRVLFYLFAFHTALTFYSAFFMSKEAWAFISTALLYILIGAYLLFEIIYRRIKFKKQLRTEEWLPIVDEQGNITGKATRSACHSNKSYLHPVVHLHVFNNKKQIFLQKRPLSKLVQPGKWDTAVGGHISFGESIETALQREASEEINISNFKPQFFRKYIWESEIERELVFMFTCEIQQIPEVNTEEVDEGRFWTAKEISAGIGKNIFTPNLEHELKLLSKT